MNKEGVKITTVPKKCWNCKYRHEIFCNYKDKDGCYEKRERLEIECVDII